MVLHPRSPARFIGNRVSGDSLSGLIETQHSRLAFGCGHPRRGAADARCGRDTGAWARRAETRPSPRPEQAWTARTSRRWAISGALVCPVAGRVTQAPRRLCRVRL